MGGEFKEVVILLQLLGAITAMLGLRAMGIPKTGTDIYRLFVGYLAILVGTLAILLFKRHDMLLAQFHTLLA